MLCWTIWLCWSLMSCKSLRSNENAFRCICIDVYILCKNCILDLIISAGGISVLIQQSFCTVLSCVVDTAGHIRTPEPHCSTSPPEKLEIGFVFCILNHSRPSDVLLWTPSSKCLNTFLCQGFICIYASVLHYECIRSIFSWWQNLSV